jgi:hypothetical protein
MQHAGPWRDDPVDPARPRASSLTPRPDRPASYRGAAAEAGAGAPARRPRPGRAQPTWPPPTWSRGRAPRSGAEAGARPGRVPMSAPIPVFDGHNDLLLSLTRPRAPLRRYGSGTRAGAPRLPRMRRVSWAASSPSTCPRRRAWRPRRVMARPLNRLELPEAIGARGRAVALDMARHCCDGAHARDALRVCRTVGEIWPAGATARSPPSCTWRARGDRPRPRRAAPLARAGLRSLGVWSGPTRSASACPCLSLEPDDGPG